MRILYSLLKRAKENQREKPANLQNTPRFDQTSSWSDSSEQSGANFLSPETKKGLEGLAKAAKMEERAAPEPVVSAPEEDSEEETEELSKEDKMRKVIESRLDPIDIGEYLMSGEIRQEVPIIPDKLVIVFKTVSDQEEAFVDNTISVEPTTISNRQFLRKMNELALAIHIYSVNGNKWPTLLTASGDINKESVETRLKHIRKLPSLVFNMVSQNLAWFTDRVNDSLTASALGNG